MEATCRVRFFHLWRDQSLLTRTGRKAAYRKPLLPDLRVAEVGGWWLYLLVACPK